MEKRILFALLSIITLLTSCNENKAEVTKLQIKNEVLVTEIAKLKKQQEVEELNKKVVTSFYQEFFGDLNLEAANKYIGDVYIQHNPEVGDGKEALIKLVEVWFKKVPKTKINFNMVFAEKDLVFIQITNEKDGNRNSQMDVFRVTDGKISEHWDAFASFKNGDVSENPNPLF